MIFLLLVIAIAAAMWATMKLSRALQRNRYSRTLDKAVDEVSGLDTDDMQRIHDEAVAMTCRLHDTAAAVQKKMDDLTVFK
jgi:hypothetical protein